jgi:hypothetical protein
MRYVMHTFTPFLWTSLDEKFENIAQSTHNGVVDWNTGYGLPCSKLFTGQGVEKIMMLPEVLF